MMARSTPLQLEAGYIDARPLTAGSSKSLATHGRTIHLGQSWHNVASIKRYSITWLSQCLLSIAAFLTGVRHANLPWGGPDAIWRSALSAFGLDTSLTLLNGDILALQSFFHQTLGFVAHRLF
jgi:hypothetical protein